MGINKGVYKFTKDLSPFTKKCSCWVKFVCGGEAYEYITVEYNSETESFALSYSLWKDKDNQELVYANAAAGKAFVGWKDERYRKIAVNYTISVQDGFEDWFLGMTEDVTKSTVTISYGDRIIVISDGQETIELPCDGKEMYRNIFIDVPEMPQPGRPIEAKTEEELLLYLNAKEAGIVVRYIGETTENYQQGQIYLVGGQ